MFPSRKLIDQFGKIEAWEKEDKVCAGKPNAAGWILPPYNNMHRRYPEVAIFKYPINEEGITREITNLKL